MPDFLALEAISYIELGEEPKKIISFISLIFAFQAGAFTLNTDDPRDLLPSGNVGIHVLDENSSHCRDLGLSEERLLDLAVKAANKYWNKVDSSIKLVKGVIGQSWNTSSIFLMCGEAAFNQFAYGYISQARGHFIAFATQKINGYYFRELTEEQQFRVIAHEIGHTLGIGHSNDDDAFMSYTYQNTELSQDDINALQYLYPPL